MNLDLDLDLDLVLHLDLVQALDLDLDLNHHRVKVMGVIVGKVLMIVMIAGIVLSVVEQAVTIKSVRVVLDWDLMDAPMIRIAVEILGVNTELVFSRNISEKGEHRELEWSKGNLQRN